MRLTAVALVVLLACLAGTNAKRKLPKVPKFIATRSDGDVKMGPLGPEFFRRGPDAVNLVKEFLGADGDGVAAFRNEALKHFNEQFDLGLESTEINAPVVESYVLQACPETANATCVPTVISPYIPVETVRSFAIARNDKPLRKTLDYLDCGYELFIGAEGFKGLAPGTALYYGIFRIPFREGNVRFFYRSLTTFEPPYYEFDLYKTDFGKAGKLTGAFRFNPKEAGVASYEDWVTIEMDV